MGAFHAQILQESSYRERRRKPAQEMENGMGMGSRLGWNGNGISRDGMGMEWEGGLAGLDPSPLPPLKGQVRQATHQL